MPKKVISHAKAQRRKDRKGKKKIWKSRNQECIFLHEFLSSKFYYFCVHGGFA